MGATPCLHSHSHCSPAAPAAEGTARSSRHGSFPSREGTEQGQDCWEQPTNMEHTCVQTPQSRGGSSEPQCHELRDGCSRAAALSPRRRWRKSSPGWGVPAGKEDI